MRAVRFKNPKYEKFTGEIRAVTAIFFRSFPPNISNKIEIEICGKDLQNWGEVSQNKHYLIKIRGYRARKSTFQLTLFEELYHVYQIENGILKLETDFFRYHGVKYPISYPYNASPWENEAKYIANLLYKKLKRR